VIRTLPNSKGYSIGFKVYICLFFTFLFAPLLVTCVLAFNDSMFPALPWKGFSMDWFFANSAERVGIFHDEANLTSIWVSFKTAFFVAIFSTIAGTCGAFLFEQEEFRFKQMLYFLMLAPLVIPGVILGISILLFSNTLGLFSKRPSASILASCVRDSGLSCWVSFLLLPPL
jgi:spermidine/putrescine transport system permease protein